MFYDVSVVVQQLIDNDHTITFNTISVVVLKQDVNTVDVVHSTEIHPPPHGRLLTVWTYILCPHTRRCISVHCVFCAVPWSRVCVGLRGVLLKGQIIFENKSMCCLSFKQRTYRQHFLQIATNHCSNARKSEFHVL